MLINAAKRRYKKYNIVNDESTCRYESAHVIAVKCAQQKSPCSINLDVSPVSEMYTVNLLILAKQIFTAVLF